MDGENYGRYVKYGAYFVQKARHACPGGRCPKHRRSTCTHVISLYGTHHSHLSPCLMLHPPHVQALGLGRDLLAVREVDYIDIADDKQMTQSKLVSYVVLRALNKLVKQDVHGGECAALRLS